jgi:hypothetical protein
MKKKKLALIVPDIDPVNLINSPCPSRSSSFPSIRMQRKSFISDLWRKRRGMMASIEHSSACLFQSNFLSIISRKTPPIDGNQDIVHHQNVRIENINVFVQVSQEEIMSEEEVMDDRNSLIKKKKKKKEKENLRMKIVRAFESILFLDSIVDH